MEQGVHVQRRAAVADRFARWLLAAGHHGHLGVRPTIHLAGDRVSAAAARCVREAAALSAVLGYWPQETRIARKEGAA
jgi:hypothetical protein